MKPEINLGGVQNIRFYSPYIATEFDLEFWPIKTFAVGETYLQWDPPTFSNFCSSQGWSWTLLKAWIDMRVELWECDAGLFNYILTGDSHECGLESYDFIGHLIEAPHLPLPFLQAAGDFFPNSCEANRPNYHGPYTGAVANVTANATANATSEETTPADEPTALNSDWF